MVFIGPNNSGKTSALQALTLWDFGVRQWLAKRGAKARPEKRPGVAISRRDLVAIPVSAADLLWRDLHVRNVRAANGKTQSTKNIRIEVIVEGVTEGIAWICGLEFDYQNAESFFCRPMRELGFEESPVAEARFTEVTIKPNRRDGCSMSKGLPTWPFCALSRTHFSTRTRQRR